MSSRTSLLIVRRDLPSVSLLRPQGRDAGVEIFHSHYQQRDGADNALGPAPANGNFNSKTINPIGSDRGGDAGGCTMSTTQAKSSQIFDKDFIQTGPAITDCTKDRD